MARSMRSRVVVAALTLVVASSACASSPVPRPSSPTPTAAVSAEGLSATLERYREDDTTHVVQIQLTNGSAKTVSVTDLALHWPGMTAQSPSPAVHVLAATQLADLPVPQGDAVCSNPPRVDEPLPAVAPYASAMASFDGGAPAAVRVPITDTRGVLARLFLADCYQKALAYAADITFADWKDATVDGRPAMTTRLRIHRTHGNAAIVIADVRGSVLLAVARATPSDGPLLRAAPGQQEVSAGLVFTESGDCRPHALAESKHTFFLPTEITVGSAAPTSLYLFPDDDAKARLLTMINRSCGV